ncbi:unnamed protein product [Cylicostephanus goldi]|uniref:UDP-N-acetylglucosamine transferase subunit ALG14 n=1 Tax=Cylicostephanus goldi TaxID=71465 RepID=A0A3P7NDI4_CYLGO|nr:unnamed protein product [Cylicostephanus goldi]
MIFVFFFCIVSVILWGVFITTGYLCYIVRHSNRGHRKHLLDPKVGTVSLCCVLGSGGHTTEMLELLKHMGSQYTPRWYVVADTDHMSKDKVGFSAVSFEKSLFA